MYVCMYKQRSYSARLPGCSGYISTQVSKKENIGEGWNTHTITGDNHYYVIQSIRGPNLKIWYLKNDPEYSCRILYGANTIIKLMEDFTKMLSRNSLTLWISYNLSNVTTRVKSSHVDAGTTFQSQGRSCSLFGRWNTAFDELQWPFTGIQQVKRIECVIICQISPEIRYWGGLEYTYNESHKMMECSSEGQTWKIHT